MSEILYDQKLCPLYVGNTCSEIDKAYQQGRADRDKELLKEVDYLLKCGMGKKKALVHLRGILVKGAKE